MPEERSYTSAELFDAIISIRDANALSFDRVWREFDRVRNELRSEFRAELGTAVGRLERGIMRIDDRLTIERQNVDARLEDHERRITHLEG